MPLMPWSDRPPCRSRHVDLPSLPSCNPRLTKGVSSPTEPPREGTLSLPLFLGRDEGGPPAYRPKSAPRPAAASSSLTFSSSSFFSSFFFASFFSPDGGGAAAGPARPHPQRTRAPPACS